MPAEFSDATNGSGSEPILDGIDLTAAGSVGAAPEPARTPGKRRGRPPGSGGTAKGTGKEKVSGKLDLSSIVGLFVGVHCLLADKTGVPELAMDMQEGQTLATAGQNVLRHYPVDTTQKAVDWMAFFGAIGMIYGTRFGSYALRKRTEAMPRNSATVYNMPERQARSDNPTPPQAQAGHGAFLPEADFEQD